jgi:hypothetical protein
MSRKESSSLIPNSELRTVEISLRIIRGRSLQDNAELIIVVVRMNSRDSERALKSNDSLKGRKVDDSAGRRMDGGRLAAPGTGGWRRESSEPLLSLERN